MRAKNIDEALEDIENSSESDKIKDLLTQSLLILIYAQFEKEIKYLLLQRCESVSDRAVKSFVLEHIQKSALRSLKVTDLSGLLKQFDLSYKTVFNQRISENGQAKAAYESLLNNRHSVAHGGSISATFDDVKMFYEKGHEVLDYFEEALQVNSRSDVI